MSTRQDPSLTDHDDVVHTPDMKLLAPHMTAAATPLVTEGELVDALRELGVEAGQTLLVHASLSSFGRMIGGEQAVIAALRTAVGPLGTIVMPSQSWQLCDPDFLDDPALDDTARTMVRNALPAFDPALTPTRSMGAVSELFRMQPASRRSAHPHRSFSAAGRHAEEIVSTHEFDSPFGETSPLARLYDLGARIVLLGVGFDKCTALHLAERRAADASRVDVVGNGAPVIVSGVRQWVTWQEPVVDDSEFERIGTRFTETGAVAEARVGNARCLAMSLPETVNFATQQLLSSR